MREPVEFLKEAQSPQDLGYIALALAVCTWDLDSVGDVLTKGLESRDALMYVGLLDDNRGSLEDIILEG